MFILIGAVLSIWIPCGIYKYILKGQEHAGKKIYIKTFLLGATLYTIPIIILEVIWDVFFKASGEPTILDCLSTAFLRAALLEEGVKFYFAYHVLKRNKELGMKEAILLAGVVGIGYGFTEKLFYGNGIAMITNALVPGHMVYQWIMGYFIYKAFHAEGKERRKLWCLAYFIPFLLHGIWDAGLDITGFLPDTNPMFLLVEFGLTVLMVILMLAGTIVLMKKIRKI